MSEYDRILAISRDGSYRIMGPEEKVLIPDKAIHIQVFDQDEGARFTVVYRDSDKMAYGKKVHIKSFIKDREYELIKDKAGRVDLLLPGDSDDIVDLKYVPKKRQRVNESTFDLAEIRFTGPAARGRRLAPKPVARVKRRKRDDGDPAPGQAPPRDDGGDGQPGLFEDDG